MARRVDEYLTYDPCNIIGQGSFGTIVFAGHLEGINSKVAIKRIQTSNMKTEKSIHKFESDFVTSKIDHPNILRYLSTKKNNDFFFVVTELCAGTLQNLIRGTYQGPKVGDEKEVLFQVTQGLAYLHGLKIVHRDIKPSNILVFSSPSSMNKPLLKLADFGICSGLLTDQRDIAEFANYIPFGTKGWIPPEMFNSNYNTTDTKLDIFPLGCIFSYTLTAGRHPFGKNPLEQSVRIKGKQPICLKQEDLKKPDSPGEKYVAFKLIKTMLEMSPTKRPTVNQILANALFQHQRQQEFKDFLVEKVDVNKPNVRKTQPKPVEDLKFSGSSKSIASVTGNKSSSVRKITYDKAHILGGRGSNNNEVFMGKLAGEDGAETKVAVKRTHLKWGAARSLVDRILGHQMRLNHPNVVKYFHFEDDGVFSLLAMELCAGSLQDFCVGRFTAALSTDLDSVKQLLEGLAYLHQNNFVHTNINPSNILISSSGTMKISGLGNCELLQPSKTDSLSSNIGTAIIRSEGWMAPELLLHNSKHLTEEKMRPSSSSTSSLIGAPRFRATTAMDVFSLGCVLYFFLTRGSHPFGSGGESRNQNILKGKHNLSRLDKSSQMLKILQHLIKEMIQNSPELRPRLQDILPRPIFNDTAEPPLSSPLTSAQGLTKHNYISEDASTSSSKRSEIKSQSKNSQFNRASLGVLGETSSIPLVEQNKQLMLPSVTWVGKTRSDLTINTPKEKDSSDNNTFKTSLLRQKSKVLNGSLPTLSNEENKSASAILTEKATEALLRTFSIDDLLERFIGLEIKNLENFERSPGLTNDSRTQSATHLGGRGRKNLKSYLKSAGRRLAASKKSIISSMKNSWRDLRNLSTYKPLDEDKN